MAISDLSGAASNYIGVMQNRGAQNAAQKQSVLGGAMKLAGGLGDAMAGGAALDKEAESKAKLVEMLKQAGLDPGIAEAGPHAAITALLQEAQRRQQQASQDATFGQQRDLVKLNSEANIAERKATIGAEFDARTAAAKAEEQRAQEQRDANRSRFNRTLSVLGAPPPEQAQDVGNPFVPFPMQPKPPMQRLAPGTMTPGLMGERYNAMPEADREPAALSYATGKGSPFLPTPQAPAKLSPYETEYQKLKAAKDMGAGDFADKSTRSDPLAEKVPDWLADALHAPRGATYRAVAQMPKPSTDASATISDALADRIGVPHGTKLSDARLWIAQARSEGANAASLEVAKIIRNAGGEEPAPAPKHSAPVRRIGKSPEPEGAVEDKAEGGAEEASPPGDPAKVKALLAAGWTWDGTKWNEPAPAGK